MKRVKYLVMTLLLLPLFILNVEASSVPYQWIVDGEEVNTEANSAGTARLEKEGKVVTLFLNNYKGGKLALDCYGTGQSGMSFIINLEGDNYITANDIGIDMGEAEDVKLEFKGEGTLEIKAPKPISNEEAVDIYTVGKESNEMVAETTEEEHPNLIATNDEEEDSTLIATKEEEKKDNKEDNDMLVRVLGGLLLVSICVISFLVVKYVIKK